MNSGCTSKSIKLLVPALKRKNNLEYFDWHHDDYSGSCLDCLFCKNYNIMHLREALENLGMQPECKEESSTYTKY